MRAYKPSGFLCVRKKAITLNKSSYFYDVCVKIKGGPTLSRRPALPFQVYEAVAVAGCNEKQVWLIPALEVAS